MLSFNHDPDPSLDFFISGKMLLGFLVESRIGQLGRFGVVHSTIGAFSEPCRCLGLQPLRNTNLYG